MLNDLIEYVSYLERDNKRAISELIPFVSGVASEQELADVQKEIVAIAGKYRLDPLFEYSSIRKETSEDLRAKDFDLLLTGSMKNITLFFNKLTKADTLFFVKEVVVVKNTNEKIPEDMKDSFAKVETDINMTDEEKEKQKERASNINNYQVNIKGYVYLRKQNEKQQEASGGDSVEGGYKEKNIIQE